jgi:hypothetical protein
MNRKEAMLLAKELVDSMSIPPTKSNGYAVDGWKAPTLAEKVDAIEKLANFLWDVEPTTEIDPNV